jgi:serralysin
MANYIFETVSASDAANFTSDDRLFFESANVAMLGVVDTPGVVGPLSSTAESITLSFGTHSATFAASQLSTASNLASSGLIFINGDELSVGTAAGETITPGDAGHGHGTAVYGFDGGDFIDMNAHGSAANDTINGGAGDDSIFGSSSFTDSHGHFTESDLLMGGAGNDFIVGGAGNDHIYGNLAASTAGAADGDDNLNGGNGNDYIQGNAGDDRLRGDDGNDRLYGGAGDDSIHGGNGNDYLQGNKGNDICLGEDGNDTIHGGAGNDLMQGTDGDDQLFGDAGDDTLGSLGTGFDTLTGGSGNDTFFFYLSDASNANVSVTTGAGAGATEVIADFTVGEDHILAFFTVDHVYHQQTGVTFTSVAAAQVYAEQLMDAGTHAGEMAAIQVGADTYLFWNLFNHDVTGVDPAHSIAEAVKLTGVTASTITTDSFT